MLAYVFWHWPRQADRVEEYEAGIEGFHAALWKNRPADLVGTGVWRVDGAAWLPRHDGYEEWYLLAGSGGLDPLNLAAVSVSVRSAHQAVADLSEGGTAGLYQTVDGRDGELTGARAHWFAKPPNIGYRQLYDALRPVLDRVWLRMMVLGPTPEVCLLGEPPAGLDLPRVDAVNRRLVLRHRA
jgi:hypothetical protein